MTNAIFTNELLNDAQLDIVTGGTFDGNMYSKKQYKNAGVYMESNIWTKDEFYIWSKVDINGNKLKSPKRYRLTYDAANAAVEFFNNYNKTATIKDLKEALGNDPVYK